MHNKESKQLSFLN